MMTTTTKKKKIQQEEEEEKPNPGGGRGGADRISELPIEILHRILGFLEMDGLLIGTSLVSTKWRNLWKSVSTLKFSATRIGHYVHNDGKITINIEKNQNFVDHVLRLRDYEASKIQIFNYSSGCHVYGQRNVDTNLEWLNNFIVTAVNQGAQEIRIMGFRSHESNTHLNPSIFTSGLLRVFVYSSYNTCLSFAAIQFPRSMCCATQLTHLNLSYIRLPEGDDDSNAAELHLVYPLLETFIMNCCHTEHLKVLDISAPRLDTLSISNIGMRYGPDFDFLGGCRLEIRTPNLTSLAYEGDVYVDCFTENLPRIANASLRRIRKERGMLEQTTSFAIKLLKGLTTAKTLTLAEFEVLSQDTLKDLLTSFTSLRTLKLITSCKISSIHWMVHFLNSCNSVEKLVWEVVDMYEFVEVEGDEHLMLPQCRLTHLKHVHIERLCGHKNAIEFVKFLLKSSVVLEDLIINTTENSPKRFVEENLKQFVEENLKQFVEENPLFGSIKLQIL